MPAANEASKRKVRIVGLALTRLPRSLLDLVEESRIDQGLEVTRPSKLIDPPTNIRPW